ncbi:MAG: HAMP domain-containing histidine kinase [Lachnospiraceae bacterium]|nr:HAMP domain-containing histidine kinase [Lachnospiraceae bacterium]
MKKKGIFGSIRIRFMISFLLLVLGVVLFMLLFNTFFLSPYYQNRKMKALDELYASLDKAASDDLLLSDEFDIELLRASRKDNIDVILMNPDSRTIKNYAPDSDVMQRRLWESLLDQTPLLSEQDQFETGNGQAAFIVQRLRESQTQVTQIVLDARTSVRYMEMWGILSDGSFYLMRTPMESIENSARLANRFLIAAGLLSAVLGLVTAYFLSGSLTRPIRQMQEISERMRSLDFTAKYRGGGSNELSELGDNLNKLSEALESNITRLKEANAALETDIRKKDETERMRKEFISNVTHELKTPIAIIQGYAEGLVDNVASDEEMRRYYCSVIAEEAARMNTMVRKMLELNHLEFGTAEVIKERFDIAASIRGYLETGRVIADREGVTVKADLDEAVFVESDQYMCEEVFVNYFTNAVHYAEGEKEVRITVQSTDSRVRVSVFNSGSPIPDEALDRIWDKFYKVDKSRSRQYGGSGIGLSIVKAAMELLGGAYGVYNTDDGVVFYFELPDAEQ